MASIQDALNTGVKVVDSVLRQGKMEATVFFRRYLSEDGFGVKTYNPPLDQPGLPLQAVVDWKQKQMRTLGGTLSVSRAYVGFLNYDELFVATGGEGVDDSDMIVLPDGTTGPILDMTGFVVPNATTSGTLPAGHPVITEVWLG